MALKQTFVFVFLWNVEPRGEKMQRNEKIEEDFLQIIYVQCFLVVFGVYWCLDVMYNVCHE